MVGQVPLRAGAAPLELLRETGVASDDRLLTIVIGSYNHCRYLPEAFAAIEASQACDRLAVIFIDDGSPDGTMDLVASYPFDPALHVRIYAKRNAGLRDSLASGLALTDTRFVAFIASDDHYEPQGLAAVVARLEVQGNDDICWICQATYLEGRDGEPVYGDAHARLIAANPGDRLRQLSISYPKPLLLQSTVFATDMLRDAHPWTANVRLDDWPTFIQVAALALRQNVSMIFVPDISLCRYRLHPGGAHNDADRQLSLCLEVADRVIEPRYRADAIARIYADIGLVHLFERRLLKAAAHITRAIVAKPSWEVATLVPRRVARSAWSRTSRLTNRFRTVKTR